MGLFEQRGTAGLTLSDERIDDQRWRTIALIAGWLILVLALLSKHVVWRDEVRAQSLALQGDTVIGMLRALHGEGHPALWYLLLRGANAVLPTATGLSAVSISVALVAMVLLVRRSPFSWALMTVFALGRPALYEYSVMARNYGISMLLMFSFAALYRRHRDRGLALGTVLFLLANCNVHSAIIAGAFCLFWLLDLCWEKTDLRRGAVRNFWLNAVLAMAGVSLCAATIYPPFNDAAQVAPGSWNLTTLAKSLIFPSLAFSEIAGYPMWRSALEFWSLSQVPYKLVMHLTMSVVLVGSVLGLVTRPAALVAAATALLGLSIFFSLIYAGGYRHQALWLIFLVSLYWIAGQSTKASAAFPPWRRWHSAGFALFVLLLVLQVALSVFHLAPVVSGRAPESRSRDLARLVAERPDLKDAIIVADPDYLVEVLPQYLSNRTYLLRERRFGNIVIFTRKARLTLALDEVLADARQLRETTGQPVVILMGERLDPAAPAQTITEGYNWKLTTTPEQVAAFLSATRRIARFGPVCCSDESFDVYVLER